MGITRVARFAGGSPGLLVLPAYIPNEDVTPLGYTMSNLVFAIIGVVIAMAVAFIASYVLFGIWARKGKLDPEETCAAPAAPAAPAKTVPAAPDDAIVSPADGKFIGPDRIVDEMVKSEAIGQTVAVEPANGVFASPANGKLEMIFETGHAFGLRMKDGTGLLIHIGVDTVELKGKGFTVLKKAGDSVTAGEPVIKADLKVIRDAGLSAQTMLVISEPLDDAKPVSFLPFGSEVTRGQRLN